jgi:hypothetical protein
MLTLRKQPKPEPQTVAPTYEIPRLTDFAEYREAADKLSGLRAEVRSIEHRMNNISFELANAKRTREEQAEELLAAGNVTADPTGELHAEYRTLAARQPVVKRAAEIQVGRVAEVRGKVSREIVRSLRPEYEKLLRRMASAAVVLGQLADAEQRFRDRLLAEEVDFSGAMPPAPLREMQLAAEGNRINLWLDNHLGADYGIEVDVPHAGAGFARRSR